MASPQYENSVFVNCPFDDAYRDLFEALIFAVHDYVVQVEQWLKLNAHIPL